MKQSGFFGIVFLLACLQLASCDISYSWRTTKVLQINRNNLTQTTPSMAYENYAFSPATSIPYLVNDTGADQVKIPIDFSTYTNGWTFECWFTTYNANPLFAGTPVFQYSVNSSIHITIAWGSALQTQFQLFVYIEGPGMTPTVLQLPPNWSNNRVAGYFYVAVSLRAAADGTSYAYGLSSRQIHTSSTFNTQSPQTFNGVSPSNFAGATFATIGSMDGAALGNNVPAQFFAGQDRKAYSGRIAEVRIWNQYIAPAALQPNFEVSPSSPGLTHLYRFAVSPTNNIATAAAPGTALQLRGNIIVLDAAKDFNQGNDRAVMDIPTYSAVISDTNSNPQFSIPTFDVFGDFGAPSPTSSASFSSPSPALVLSPAVSGSTVGIFSSPGTSSSNTFIGSTLNFTRAFCGSLANVTITVTSSVGTPSVVATPLQLQLSWPSLSWQVTSVSIPPTTGGTVTITGTNFGIASSLAGTESILLKGVACTSAVVVSTTSIQCQIAAGTGSGLASISICGVTNSSASSFRYAAPVVSAVNTVDLSTIRLTGTGFNPSSTWNTGRDSIRVTGGTLPAAGVNCAVNSTSVTSATEVSCIPATALVAGSSYSVNITIDGQSTTQSFSFSPCFPACQNNGQCVGVNQCNCLGTSGSGPLCGTPVICSPECQNGGTCYNPNTGSGNTTAGTCNCAVSTNPGSDGDCSTRLVESTLSTGAIIGIAVGVGVVLIVLVVVIIILAIRRPKRYKSSAIIPVEKKDFTKIIYGEQLDEGHPDKKAGDLDALENLLVQGNLDTVFALNKITAITEADKIAKALVIIFEAHHKTMDLLKAFTTDEVKATDSAANLFRSNSMVSKMFKFYSRLVGLPYLYKTIAPEIYEIVEKEELHLEVDPEKLEEGSDLDEMRWTLMAESQKILKQILHSVTGIPAPFAELMSHVKSTVVSKFPDNVNTTIGGFIFLRFFCPAISSPEAYGVVEEPPQPNARRLLILITKVLQNLSNDVEFGSKEPYMTKMNDFIITNRPKISEFYVNMEKSRSNAFNAPTLPKHMKAVSLAVISEHFRTNFDKIENKDLKTQLDPIIKKD